MSAINVTLPDGTLLEFESGATVLAVAERIGPGLAKAALAGRIDGEIVDLRRPIESDVALEIVTTKDPAGGDVIRHSAEHVMAEAVKRLFPNAQVDAGRSDHSEKFQYDFLVEKPFTPEDIERIEEEMKSIISDDVEFERRVVSREEASSFFREKGEELKLSRLADIPDDAEITLFSHGDFSDLCRGPHVQRTSQIGA
ncbi:MAG: TGS domain-containing protein, partial [Myxococcota bacterium]